MWPNARSAPSRPRPTSAASSSTRGECGAVSTCHCHRSSASRPRTGPTLVLWGEHDEWLAPSVDDRLTAAIPGARRATVPGAGHFVAEDNPRDTAAELIRFFRAVPDS
ncbi:alpha/beta fold hydrolase [Saccharopolyspora sp. NPDC002376]